MTSTRISRTVEPAYHDRRTPRRWSALGAGLAAAALLLASAGPAAAETEKRPISQGSGNALSVNLAGKSAGVGEYRAWHDGEKEQTSGSNRPPSPIGDGQSSVITGALGQDAEAKGDGTSAACSGLVGADGTIQIGPDRSCLIDGQGKVHLSLGSLSELGPDDLPLPELPELPELPDLPLDPNGLPDLELRLDAEAISAQCQATVDDASGSAKLSDVQLVGVVGDQVIPILDVPTNNAPNANLAVTLADLLTALGQNLPGFDQVLDQIEEQVPGDELPTDQLIKVVSNEQVKDDADTISVTGLAVHVVPNDLADVRIGQATCGPNRAASANRPNPTPTPTPTDGSSPEPEPTDQPVPTSVPAGLASGPGDGAGGIGPGVLVAAGIGGLLLGGYLHRRRRT